MTSTLLRLTRCMDLAGAHDALSYRSPTLLKTYRRLAVALLAALAAVAAGTASAAADRADPSAGLVPLGPPTVLCHTSQGNGFNWAASLGWLAESLGQEALEAGRNTTVEGTLYNPQCAAGSSSAAGTVALLAALVGNPSLFGADAVASGLFTADDLATLSRALRLVGLATDFGPDEQVAFAARYLVPEDAGQSSGVWWPSRYGEDLIRHTLARRILLASRLQRKDLERPVDPEDAYSREARRVTDVIEAAALSDLPSPESADEVRALRFLAAQRRLAAAIARERLGADIWNWNARADAFLRSTPVPEGFITTTFALVDPLAPGDVPVVDNAPPAFPRLRKLALMGETTLERIAASPPFVGSATSRDFVLASVPSLYELLRLSQAEPENQRRIAGSARSLGITTLVDVGSGDGSIMDSKAPDDFGIVIAGGWTPPETSAWPLIHYAQDLATERGATRVVSRRFGKPGRTATFPRQVMERYFFRNIDGSTPMNAAHNVGDYLDLYYRDSDRHEVEASSLFGPTGVALSSLKTTFNWDIARRPAAAAGLSQSLILGVANTWRAGLPPGQAHPKPFVFVPRR